MCRVLVCLPVCPPACLPRRILHARPGALGGRACGLRDAGFIEPLRRMCANEGRLRGSRLGAMWFGKVLQDGGERGARGEGDDELACCTVLGRLIGFGRRTTKDLRDR